jgi:hypothetical protein
VSAFEESDPSAVVELGPAVPPVEDPVYSTPSGCAEIYIDGVDVTNCALAGFSTRRLNRPSQAQVRLPMDCAIGAAGSLLKIYFNGTLHHHGRVLLCETTADENTGYVVYNSTDPMEMWAYRPVRDDTCDFSKPTIVEDYGPSGGPAIVENMLQNSMGVGGCSGGDCEDANADICEGDLFLTLGTFEGGCCDLSGAPVDWPMTMAELTSLLISTGCCDIVITPTDPGGGIMGTVAGYCGDYGTDLSGSVDFDYGQGNFNVRALRWNEDMSNMCNKLWYFAGPRIQTPADPAGDQHWCFNVTGDDLLLPDPLPNGASRATLLANRLTGRAAYGTRMDIQIFDATDDDCVPGWGTYGRDLYRTRWETESWIRNVPRNLIHITPTRGTEIMGFDIGDIVGVSATGAVRGGFSGAQRVYEYTIGWDDDGVCFLSELQTSDTADS